MEYISDLVSVIVPVYNREYLVGKTLDSILCQSYPQIEIVAVNDGSSDGSLRVLSEYALRFPDRIIVIDQQNSGQVKARNNGIAASRGEYVAFLDSDDTWERDKLTLQIPLFKDNVGLVYSGINEVDPEGRITATVLPEPSMRGDIYRHLLVGNRMTGGSVVVTRKALDTVGNFDESFRAAENWDLWIRISREYGVEFVNQPLVNYLKHPGNMSQDGSRMSQSTWDILQKHLPDIPKEKALKGIFLEAYADYYYGLGVQYFGKNEYSEARKMFFLCWKYVPGYRDSLMRVFRTLLGSGVNRALSRLKSKK
jgi:glycosyltransferase involved in cell wall biosynthesis